MSDNGAPASVPRKFAADVGCVMNSKWPTGKPSTPKGVEEQGHEAWMEAPETQDGDSADPGTARTPPNSTLISPRAGIRMVSPPPGHVRGIVMPAREVLAGMSRAGLLEHRVRLREASMVSGVGC